jgi:hypothetical protein
MAQWLNQVERFFTETPLRHSIDALHTAINNFIDPHNADPKPFPLDQIGR